MNTIWGKSKADLVGKLDNDCLVTSGWARTLAKAHEDIEDLGVVACWHFRVDDFDCKRAKHKIQTFGQHRLLRHPWTCGTGLLIKRETFARFGPIQGPGTTQYWLRMAVAGMVNGFYYPFVLQEHMDDPKSSYCKVKDDESLRKMKEVTYVLSRHNINSMSERWHRREVVLDNLNGDPWEAKHYVGWRKKLRGIRRRVDNLIWRMQYWRNSQQEQNR